MLNNVRVEHTKNRDKVLVDKKFLGTKTNSLTLIFTQDSCYEQGDWNKTNYKHTIDKYIKMTFVRDSVIKSIKENCILI